MNVKPQKLLQEGIWIWAGAAKGVPLPKWERGSSVILGARSSRRIEFLVNSNQVTVMRQQRKNETNGTDKSAGKLIVFCQRDELFWCTLSLERNSPDPAAELYPEQQQSSEVWWKPGMPGFITVMRGTGDLSLHNGHGTWDPIQFFLGTLCCSVSGCHVTRVVPATGVQLPTPDYQPPSMAPQPRWSECSLWVRWEISSPLPFPVLSSRQEHAYMKQ